ncbi:hypothetical protein FACS189472_09950 [Alphaproteobacteria bacterium]|nr:hypothetical protein FACS189472_09950 [Alphaproteobacteria bacterium]
MIRGANIQEHIAEYLLDGFEIEFESHYDGGGVDILLWRKPTPPLLTPKNDYTGHAFNDVCAICLSDEHDGEVVTKCGHLFHAECINTWVNEHHACPVCRHHC